MGKHKVATVAELPEGERRVVTLEGRSIGIFNVSGNYYALKNTCPHQGAPLCLGSISGMTFPSAPGEYIYGREGEILRCPWHGWEFDLTNGKSIFDPQKCFVKTYDVTVEEEGDKEPLSVETYPVTIESDSIIVHI